MSITEAELLEALADAVGGTAPDDAMTVVEMVEATGAADKRIRSALRAFQRDGRLGVHRVMRPGIDGRRMMLPAYTILAKPKAKK